MSAPARTGPTMAPNCMTVMLSEAAEASWSGGRSRGMIAVRVGWLTAKNACCTASNASTSQMLRLPSAACSQNPPVVTTSPAVVTSSSVRRSIESDSAPPQIPNTTRGTSAKAPASPT